MEPGIVQNNNHHLVPIPVFDQFSQERFSALRIELLFLYCNQCPIIGTNSPYDANLMPYRSMLHNGILLIPRKPGGQTRAMLLEVAFVHEP